MKITSFLILFFLFSFSNHVLSQILHHQSINSQGSSIKLSNGLFVSQTIGQQSVIGTKINSNFVVQQGFQQYLKGTYIFKDFDSNLANQVYLYPNPVTSVLNIQFYKDIVDKVTVSIFNMNGKLVFKRANNLLLNNLLTLDSIGILSSGVYVVIIESGNQSFKSKFLKL